MTDAHSPVAGWYDDPEMALRLRWWDGVRWTTHTRAKRVVEQPADPSGALAVPSAAEPYGYSAPYSWSPGSVGATPASPVAPASPAAPAQPLGTYGARTRRPDEVWNTRGSSIDYAPERWTTPASWALAITPLITVLSQAAAVVLSGFESTPWIWLAGAAIIPVLWIIIWVRRDRLTLDEWGHLERAHWGWAFLTEVGYLTARTIVVRRQTRGHGWAPLVMNLLSIAVLINVGIFTPVVGIVLGSVTF